MKLVNKEFIDKLLDKEENQIEYTEEELDTFYYYDSEVNVYVGCYNIQGALLIEDFKTKIGCELFCDSNLDLSAIHRIDQDIFKLIKQARPEIVSKEIQVLEVEIKFLKKKLNEINRISKTS